MPRIVKHPDLRRQELLDCAQALFLARGYDHASLNDVIAEAGISKGAFYHYFASKEALLEALAERFAAQALDQLKDVLDEGEGLNALARLNRFLAKSWRNKIETAPTAWALFEVLYRPENFVLFHRINLAAAALFTPPLARIVAQGVEEGVFATDEPEGVAEMLLQLATSARAVIAKAIAAGTDEEMDRAIAALERRTRLYEIALNAVLGLPDGSVHLLEPGLMRAVMTARPKQADGGVGEQNSIGLVPEHR